MFVHCELLTHRSRSDCTWNRYGRSAKSSSIDAMYASTHLLTSGDMLVFAGP